jgi:hypothetical protein
MMLRLKKVFTVCSMADVETRVQFRGRNMLHEIKHAVYSFSFLVLGEAQSMFRGRSKSVNRYRCLKYVSALNNPHIC